MIDRGKGLRPGGRMVPISFRLLGASLVVGAVAVTIAYFSLERIHALNELRAQTVAALADRATLAALIKEDVAAILRAQQDMLRAKSDDEFQRYTDRIDRQVLSIEDRMARLEPLLSDEDRGHLAEFKKRWHDWRENHELVRSFAQLKSDELARNIAQDSSEKAFEQLNTAIEQIVDRNERAAMADDGAVDEPALRTNTARLLAAERLQHAVATVRQTELNLLLAKTEDELESGEAAFAPLEKDIAQRFDALQATIDEAHDPDDAASLAAAQQAMRDYWAANANVRGAVGQKGGFLAEHFAFDVGSPLAAASESALESLAAGNEQDVEAHRIQSDLNYTSARNALIGFTIIGVLASTIAALLTGHGIARRLNRLTHYAKTIHETGDLSLPVPPITGDEVGQLATAFEQMRSSLHDKATQLAAINEALAQKSREMEQFVYTVSHDLKSPLVSLKGLLMLLKEDILAGDNEAVLGSVQGLEGAANQLGQIIDDLLTLSRIGSKPLVLVQLKARDLVLELAEELAPRIAESGAALEIQDLPDVIADRVDFIRAMENLLVNALKYGCTEPDPKVVVGGVMTPHEVRFFVQDNGPGIEPEYHDKIFGLFQRLRTDTEGTGLGLASVAKVMRLHGGQTWVESAPGEGATFWIAFPRLGLRSLETAAGMVQR